MKSATIFAFACVSLAAGQGTITVDLLDPSDEGFAGIPAYRRCVDVFVDVDPADAWTVAGLRVTAHQGATFEYWDGDANITDQGGLFNVGVANRFETSLSRPRQRNANARFNNAGAFAAGAFDPTGPNVVASNTELNVAYLGIPPATSGSPSVDGYIARIAVDVWGLVPNDDYAGWSAGALADATPGALIVLRSEPIAEAAGTVFATYDDPTIRGIDWGLWFVPEPGAVGGFVALIAMLRSRATPRTR